MLMATFFYTAKVMDNLARAVKLGNLLPLKLAWM
jgi:hypothetical protein